MVGVCLGFGFGVVVAADFGGFGWYGWVRVVVVFVLLSEAFVCFRVADLD